jgi:photosystem II stability/assembly factor-like uncharacterized protein
MKRIFTTTLLISLIGIFYLTAQERIYAPQLSLPLNGAVNQMPNVVLDWNAVTGGNTGIIKYDIQLDTDPAFSSPVNFQTELVSAYKTSTLLFGETYYWHVRAKDGDETSGWSETWSFRVIIRPTLSKPLDASEQKTDLSLVWTAVTGITEYDYQLDTTYYWKPVNSGQSGIIYSSAIVDENHAWLVGASGLVLFFDGVTWTEQESNLSTDILDVHFTDINNGWAVGKSGKIVHYNGTEWTAQTSGVSGDLKGVSMLSPTNGWAVGKAGIILHYDGSSWMPQDTAAKDLNKVFAVDANHVWAVGNVGVIQFYNGTQWVEQESATARDLFDVGFADANHGWAVGKTGELTEYKNGTWTKLVHSLTSGRDLNAIYFTGSDNAWAVGKTGLVLQYDGLEWFNQSGASSANLNTVGFSGSLGFIAGDAGTLIRYNTNAFSSPIAIIHHVPGTLSTTTIKDLLFGTQYFWRMRTKHSQATSEWSGARSFNTISTVELTKPENNAPNLELDVLLKWEKLSNEVTYEIQIDDDPAYGSPIFLATSGIQINAELLKFGTAYNWRVRALHAFDVSDWSASWKFTTAGSVTLVSPANTATDQKLSPLLTWKAISGSAGYQIVVDDNNSFSEPLAGEILPATETSFIVPLVLDKNAIYYWKVRAINGLDTSNWSNIWSFKTMPPVGIGEQDLGGLLTIYPNPAEHTIFIEIKEKQSLSLHLTISDLVGKTVVEKNIALDQGNRIISIDISNLQNGIYMLRMDDQERIFTKKLVIRR